MAEMAQLVEMIQTEMDMQRLELAKHMEALVIRLGNGSPAPVAPAASVPGFTALRPYFGTLKGLPGQVSQVRRS